MTAANLARLEQPHQQLLGTHPRSRQPAKVVVDFDQIQLRMTGKKFELSPLGKLWQISVAEALRRDSPSDHQEQLA